MGASFAIGLAALNTGNNLLYLILAMMLSFLAISGVLSEQTMRQVALRREVPRRIFAAAPASFGVCLVNRKRWLASYALHLSEANPSGGPGCSQFFLKLAPLARESWQYPLTFPRRGSHQLPGLRLSTRYPFGLVTKISRPLLAGPVLVFPAVRRLAPGEIPAELDSGCRKRDRRGQGPGLHNLRPYRPGDDPRLLHWKTSARAGDLMVKELEDEGRQRVRLVVEDPAPDTPPDVVETNLSLAASLAAHALGGGIPLQLVTAAGATEFGQGESHLDRILEHLALYEPPAGPRGLSIPGEPAPAIRIRLDAPPAGSGLRA
jgi:uncharacterized protein (DUF58 family)